MDIAFFATYISKYTIYIKSVETKAKIYYTNHRGGNKMKLEIKLDINQKEPKVLIITHKVTDEVNQIINSLSLSKSAVISGQKQDKVEIIKPVDIIRIYSSNQKVYVQTDNGEYTIKMRLYQIEEQLHNLKFVRISNSEIINLEKVDYFDFKFVGTISVKMINGQTTYVSRRCMKKLKEILGM